MSLLITTHAFDLVYRKDLVSLRNLKGCVAGSPLTEVHDVYFAYRFQRESQVLALCKTYGTNINKPANILPVSTRSPTSCSFDDSSARGALAANSTLLESWCRVLMRAMISCLFSTPLRLESSSSGVKRICGWSDMDNYFGSEVSGIQRIQLRQSR